MAAQDTQGAGKIGIRRTGHRAFSPAAGRAYICAAVAAAALLCLIAGAGAARADCCQCTTPFDGGNFCGPTQFVPCGFSNADVQCSSTVIVGGTCVGGTNANGSGTGGVCTIPKTEAPVLGGLSSPAFVMTTIGLIIAAGVLLRRRVRE